MTAAATVDVIAADEMQRALARLTSSGIRLAPALRMAVLMVAVAEDRPALSIATVAAVVGVKPLTLQRHLERAAALRILITSDDRVLGYRLSDWRPAEARELITYGET